MVPAPASCRPAGEVVISMRPISVFAKDAGSGIEQLEADLLEGELMPCRDLATSRC
jgi:hypothetical protein